MSKKVLITGGSGFLGSHTADALSAVGHEVFLFDLEESLWAGKNQKVIVGDLMDQSVVAEAVSQVDVVYHFAGLAEIEAARKNPRLAIETNVLGTTNILEAMVKHNKKRLVFASTMYAFSTAGSFYRASKQAAETLIEEYSKEFQIDFVFIRYGSLYGPRAQSWNGVNKIISGILENNVAVLRGSGEEVREYIHVTDAALISAAFCQEKLPNAPVIVTGQQSLKQIDFAKLIFEMLGKEPKFQFGDGTKSGDHYVFTPYRFEKKIARKRTLPSHIDLGHGVQLLLESLNGSDERF